MTRGKKIRDEMAIVGRMGTREDHEGDHNGRRMHRDDDETSWGERRLEGGGGQQIEEKKKAASVCVYIYRDIIEGTKETIRPKRSSRAFTDLTRRGRIGARSTPSEPAATRRRN